MDTPSEPPADTPGDVASVGLAEAARLCGVSKPTVRRRAEALQAHGAVVSEGGWSIPIPALVAVGLLDRVTPSSPVRRAGVSPGVSSIPVTPVPPSAEAEEVARLRSDVEAWRRRAEVAEAVAAERERTIEAQAMALRMLEAPKPTAAEEQSALLPQRPELAPAAVAPRRWRRRRGA